ncbi:MAG TPA: hypothetical protein VHI98_29680 [Vicinamibacterales bacterium]|jgi:hypothetical protein|nr:hypothetical protein [Vicinamibacterales bacterium]
MARALEKRFDAVCRAEIARMTVKTRGLTPAERSALEDLACQVVGAIAARASVALGQSDSENLGKVLTQLFEVKEAP